ncbi:membrane glycoprotein UL9 [Human betaherpesvirus 5]|uniref:Membrane glycoprotein UL9 n=1 Tax=Human cytomegalovirus TaxID=10359 RepID=A0A0G2U726_HCMV|nr:membrane glycoprotein UL9 [Human betaherpesvirus 5]
MYRYTWLLWWITTLLRIQQFYQWWKPDTTSCIQKTGYEGQNLSLPPSNASSSKDYTFSWYKDLLKALNMLCYYTEKLEEIDSKPDIIRRCFWNHTLFLINLTSHYSGIYYFDSLYTYGWVLRTPLCYNVTVYSIYQTHIHTTMLLYPPTSTYNSLTISSFTSTNLTPTAVHYAAGNVEAQHDTATPHTMWIIPLVIVTTIIVLICFKFPQKAWNKFTQYRYNSMLAAA